MGFRVTRAAVRTVFDNRINVVQSIRALGTRVVMVGIPSNTAGDHPDRKGFINNAALGYIHETGDPSRNLPARPWLRPSVKKMQPEVISRLKKASQFALAGNAGEATNALEALGLRAARNAQAYIESKDEFAPLADVTLEARIRRGRPKGGEARELARRDRGLPPSNQDVTPLYDTGNMLHAISYVVRNR